MSSTARESAAQKAEFAAMIEAAKSRMHQVSLSVHKFYRVNHFVHTLSTVSSTIFCTLSKDGLRKPLKNLCLINLISN